MDRTGRVALQIEGADALVDLPIARLQLFDAMTKFARLLDLRRRVGGRVGLGEQFLIDARFHHAGAEDLGLQPLLDAVRSLALELSAETAQLPIDAGELLC